MIWLEPWTALSEIEWSDEEARDYRDGWEAQLKTEVGPGHVLFGRSALLIARRFDTDDALFQLSGAQVAEVHLTWRRSAEPDPRWPATAVFQSLDDWALASMAATHADWAAAMRGER